MAPNYLRKIGTNECFAYSPFLEARGDMTEWIGPLPWENKASVVVPVAAIAIPVIEGPVVIPTREPIEELVGNNIVEAPAEVVRAPEEVNPLACTICGFVAKNASGVRMHMKKHA